jgi:diguanylate cyclase (GGDEF)-like protein
MTPLWSFAVSAPLLGLLAVAAAILASQRNRAEARLRRLAVSDVLTGVLNRGAFMALTERELARGRRSGKPFAVVMLDLDHFERVNGRLGHPGGDRVLAELARRMGAELRANDLLGRYGGGKFCAVLPGVRHAEAMVVAERARATVQAAPLAGLEVTVSVGVASFEGAAGPALDYVIERADSALYAAKGLGRNRVVGIEPSRARIAPRAAWIPREG